MTTSDQLHAMMTDRAMSLDEIFAMRDSLRRCCRCDHYKRELGTCVCKERGAFTNQPIERPSEVGCNFFDDEG